MTPTHQHGRDAAQRVKRTIEAGELPLIGDSLVMLTYHLSMELRRVPERERVQTALSITRRVIANTRESLD